MQEIISYFQLGANTFALFVAGWIYVAYIKNLKSSLGLKDEQIKVIGQKEIFWKEKAAELEKRSPEHVEKLLSERIQIREEEIKRLSEDATVHKAEITLKNEELIRLKNELEKSKDMRRTMDLLELDLEDDDFFSKNASYEIEEMGLVAVDSGQLMITDPCYIDSEWQNVKPEILRLYRDKLTGEIYQFDKHFTNYNETIKGFDKSVNELIEENRLEELEIDYSNKITYSYAGACYSTSTNKGYGVLPFKLGHEGAGVAVKTVLGDGMYPVYAEKYDNKIVRVYFNLI
jgi:hypothetical protein